MSASDPSLPSIAQTINFASIWNDFNSEPSKKHRGGSKTHFANSSRSEINLEEEKDSTKPAHEFAGLVRLIKNKGLSKTSKSTVWDKGSTPLQSLIGYTSVSIKIKDSQLLNIFTGALDISKATYPESGNAEKTNAEIILINDKINSLRNAKLEESIRFRSQPRFENLNFWKNE